MDPLAKLVKFIFETTAKVTWAAAFGGVLLALATIAGAAALAGFALLTLQAAALLLGGALGLEFDRWRKQSRERRDRLDEEEKDQHQVRLKDEMVERDRREQLAALRHAKEVADAETMVLREKARIRAQQLEIEEREQEHRKQMQMRHERFERDSNQLQLAYKRLDDLCDLDMRLRERAASFGLNDDEILRLQRERDDCAQLIAAVYSEIGALCDELQVPRRRVELAEHALKRVSAAADVKTFVADHHVRVVQEKRVTEAREADALLASEVDKGDKALMEAAAEEEEATAAKKEFRAY